MKVGIIADVHANLEAFEAVLRGFDAVGVDDIVHCGDIVGYCASPNECIELVLSRRIKSVLGNHDAVACGHSDDDFFSKDAKAAIQWTAGQLTPENSEYLHSLPKEIAFDDYIFVHGSLMSWDDYIVDLLDVMLQLEYLNGRPEHICFFGQTHKAAMFRLYGKEPRLQGNMSWRKTTSISSILVQWGSPVMKTGVQDMPSLIPAQEP